MFEVRMMWAWVQAYAHEVSTSKARSERGVTAIEYALLAAGVAGIALAVVLIVKTKVLDKANSIPTN